MHLSVGGQQTGHVGVRQLEHRRLDGGGGDGWVEALQGRAQSGRADHLALVDAFRCGAVAIELGGEDVAVADVLEPLQILLLQVVFGDACHGVRLKTLPGPAAG